MKSRKSIGTHFNAAFAIANKSHCYKLKKNKNIEEEKIEKNKLIKIDTEKKR